MHVNQNNSEAPTFLVYPKRKSAQNMEAEMYLQFSYELNKINKSLGMRISFDQWDQATHSIKGQPLHNELLQNKLNEYKQKVMGAYYMLIQNGGEVTIREIVDMAFGKPGGRIYSLFGVFENLILKMEKLIKPGQSKANLQKHRACLKHLRDYVRQKYKVNDMPFSRINRQFIDDFDHFLRLDGVTEIIRPIKPCRSSKRYTGSPWITGGQPIMRLPGKDSPIKRLPGPF